MSFDASLAIAIIALLMTFLQVVRSRKWADRAQANEERHAQLQGQMHEVQLALANLELSEKHAEESAKQKANVSLALRHVGGHDYKFYVENQGHAIACNVTVQMSGRNGSGSPLVESEAEEKLPAEILPGKRVALLASIHGESYPPFDAVISWEDPDGISRERKQEVHLEN